MAIKFLHEGGLTAMSTAESRLFSANYGLNPVLMIESSKGTDVEILLSKLGVALGFPISALYSSPPGNPALLSKMIPLTYDLGAAIHHCRNLAKAYASTLSQYQRILSIDGHVEPEFDLASFGRQLEPYYELDALLSAGRRIYDKIGHCIWQAFEGNDGGMPRSFPDLLARLTRCPEPLKERLRWSWVNVGSKLRDYRDCTQHFASTDVGLGHVTMKRLAKGLWVAWARIPDNPETKSKKKFKYNADHDALTYGWEVVNEVTSLAAEAIAAAKASDSPPALESESERR